MAIIMTKTVVHRSSIEQDWSLMGWYGCFMENNGWCCLVMMQLGMTVIPHNSWPSLWPVGMLKQPLPCSTILNRTLPWRHSEKWQDDSYQWTLDRRKGTSTNGLREHTEQCMAGRSPHLRDCDKIRQRSDRIWSAWAPSTLWVAIPFLDSMQTRSKCFLL